MVMFLVEGKHQLRVDVEVGGALSDGRQSIGYALGAFLILFSLICDLAALRYAKQ